MTGFSALLVLFSLSVPLAAKAQEPAAPTAEVKPPADWKADLEKRRAPMPHCAMNFSR
jgi:uncharacterized membrane protein